MGRLTVWRPKCQLQAPAGLAPPGAVTGTLSHVALLGVRGLGPRRGVSASVSCPPLLVSCWIWGSLSSPNPHHIHICKRPFPKHSHIHSLRGHELGGGERGGDATRHGIRLFLGDGGCVSRGWGPRPDFARRRDHPVCQNKTCALGRAERGQHPVPHCSDSAADWSVTEPSRSDSGTFRLSWKCGVRVLKSQGP